MDASVDRASRVESWMVAYLADLLDIPADEVDVTEPFDRLGLDSAAAVSFTSDLGKWIGTELDLTLMFENDTIRTAAHHVAHHLAGTRDDALRA